MTEISTQTAEIEGLTAEQVKRVVRQTCQELGVLPEAILGKDVIARHDRAFYERMKRSDIVRKSKQGGQSAQIRFIYSDYLEFLATNKI